VSTQPAVARSWQVVVVDSLTRTQISQYAGASGDFNPVHIDEPYATRVAGQPAVFAHGMLTMGLTGRAVTERFGADAVRAFGGRFTGQVWPGDTLTATLTETDAAAGDVMLEVVTTNQDGQPVFRGTARIAVVSGGHE
jgi:acyl dehydratase